MLGDAKSSMQQTIEPGQMNLGHSINDEETNGGEVEITNVTSPPMGHNEGGGVEEIQPLQASNTLE